MHIFILFFFFNAPATTEIYTLSLHDALPISVYVMSPFRIRFSALPATNHLNGSGKMVVFTATRSTVPSAWMSTSVGALPLRSEEHTSELQSQSNLVCRLLLEKKNKTVLRSGY